MQAKHPTAGIILAAGASRRLGRPKQLLQIGTRTLLERVIDSALASRLDQVVLVLGHQFERILSALGDRPQNPRLQVVVNEDYALGMSGSLQRGLQQVRDAFPAVMVILGDHPFLDTASIDSLLSQFRRSPKEIGVASIQGRQGLPVCFSSRFYDAIMQIRGDMGARNIIRSHPESVLAVEIDNRECFFDIDDTADLRRCQALLTADRQ